MLFWSAAHQDIYKFDPDKFTLEGDGTDCVTIKLV
jgi:hypothetical protein